MESSRDLSHATGSGLDASAQHRPGSVPLVIHAGMDGCVVSCDGQIVARAPTFLDACEALHRLRAIRAFASETLIHTLSKKAA